MNTINNEQDLDALRRHANAWAVIATWAKLGLFEALGDSEPVRAEDLPIHLDALRNTAPILAHLGLLLHHPQSDGGDAWALSPAAKCMVDDGLLHQDRALASFQDLGRLQPVFEQGGPVHDEKGHSRLTSGGVVTADKAKTIAFMDMLYRRSDESSASLASLLATRVTQGHALDLGGGHGRYGHELLSHGLTVTLFDRAECCDIAKARYGETIATIAGDFMVDDLGGPYQLIVLSNIVHGLSPEELDSLLPRLRKVLVPGGVIAIKDMFLDATMAQPEPAALFGLTMLMYTEAGRSYGLREMVNALGKAGFSNTEHIDFPEQRFSVIMGR
jgi:hypothetical protein